MLIEHRGLVVNVASHAAARGKSEQSRVILPYSVCKAGLRRLTSDMAAELRRLGVTVFEVWPPASKTEGVLAQPDVFENVDSWKPPVFTGRVIAELAARPLDMARSGEPLVIDELAEEFGIAASA
jgi:NAD(P)-dependent dehydrogenase (short-subunit alcohol dehydrogenase family)